MFLKLVFITLAALIIIAGFLLSLGPWSKKGSVAIGLGAGIVGSMIFKFLVLH